MFKPLGSYMSYKGSRSVEPTCAQPKGKSACKIVAVSLAQWSPGTVEVTSCWISVHILTIPFAWSFASGSHCLPKHVKEAIGSRRGP